MKTALFVVVLVALLGMLVRTFESKFAFYPFAGETTTPRESGIAFEAATVATRDGERLRAWVLQGTAKGSILYFHGNGGNLSIWAPILAGIARRGYSVFAFDYRGYGVSTGRPTEQGLYRDVDAVLERFWKDQPSRPVVYWGRSLGGVMAAYAAARRSPDGLILESTFPDVRTLVRGSPPMALLGLFTSYRFPAAEFLQRRPGPPAPVLVMHGDRDEFIPIGQGRALYDRISGPKRFVTIEGGEHNDVNPREPRAYWAGVEEFIDGMVQPRLDAASGC